MIKLHRSSGALQWPLANNALLVPARQLETNMAAPGKATVVLKAVKKIAVHFCPFEANVRSTRLDARGWIWGACAVPNNRK